ncbi:hypothetical protein PENTCL1PPCAC_445, partial [Pristionchus entomophagus]
SRCYPSPRRERSFPSHRSRSPRRERSPRRDRSSRRDRGSDRDRRDRSSDRDSRRSPHATSAEMDTVCRGENKGPLIATASASHVLALVIRKRYKILSRPARLDRAIAGEVSAGHATAMEQQNSNEQSEKFNATENLKKWRKWRRRSCTTSDETRRRILIFIHFPYNLSVLIIYWTAHIN